MRGWCELERAVELRESDKGEDNRQDVGRFVFRLGRMGLFLFRTRKNSAKFVEVIERGKFWVLNLIFNFREKVGNSRHKIAVFPPSVLFFYLGTAFKQTPDP